METLTETSVLPHSHYPMSHSGYYAKRDPSSLYFLNSGQTPVPGYGTYAGYSQASERKSHADLQHPGHQHQRGHPSSRESGSEERSTVSGTEVYYPPAVHSSSSPHPNSSQYHRQTHQPSHHLSPSSSLPSYTLHPSLKERGQKGDNRKTDGSDGDILNTLDSSFNPERSIGNSQVLNDAKFPRSKDSNTSYDEEIQTPPYYFNKCSNRYVGYMGNNRPMFNHQGYSDLQHTLQGMYSVGPYDKNGKLNNTPVAKSDTELPAHEAMALSKNTESSYKEILEGSGSSETCSSASITVQEHKIEEGNPNCTMNLDSSHNIEPHQEVGYKMKNCLNQGVMNNPFFHRNRELSAWEGMTSPMRPVCKGNGKPTGDGLSNKQLSRPEELERHIITPEKSDPAMQAHLQKNSPQIMREHIVDGFNSCFRPGINPEFQLSSHNAPNLHTPTPEKSASVPPVHEHNAFGKAPPPHPWGAHPHYSSVTLKSRDPQNESKDHPVLVGNKEVAREQQTSPGKGSHFSKQGRETREMSNPSTPQKTLISYPPFPSPDKEPLISSTPNKVSPHRVTVAGKSRNESCSSGGGESVSWDDGNLIAKKEVFSDGEDDKAFPDSRTRSPMTPPSPDAASTYPPHFSHQFFASSARGPFPSHRISYGSHQGPHNPTQSGHGFSIVNQDLTGHFPLSGLNPEMALRGPLHPHGSQFMGPGPCTLGQGRSMNDDKDIFFCHLCSYSGKSKPEFDSHMNIHFEYNCPHCDYTSRTEGRLRRHIKDFHSDDSSRRSMPGRPKIYKCKTCPFQATEKDEFWAHARIHIKDEKMLQCPKCPFVTEYKHHLEYHLRNHFGSKPFKCNKCNYSCVNKSMLNSHMKSHTNVYQYRCSDCTYATKYCHSLKLHLKKYNHKPATVLNQDGSLPLGLDAESSGLSVCAKRGPPRGPRGPRKDKNDPYQFFGVPQVPLGLNQMFNSSMMPFWSLLPPTSLPGHPSPQPRILPEIRNLSQHLIREDDNSESRKGLDTENEDINEDSGEENCSLLKDDVVCKLCNYIGESTEALCLHFVQEHKEEARKVARTYGINDVSMVETMGQGGPTLKKRRMSVSLVDSESEQEFEIQCRKVISELQLKENPPELLEIQTNHDLGTSNVPPASWPPSAYSNVAGNGGRLFDVCYHGMDSDNENISGPPEGMDILQQMTLKFGNSALPETPKSQVKDMNEMETKVGTDGSESSDGFSSRSQQKETPLDLTKPKSVSPPLYNCKTPNEEGRGIPIVDREGKLLDLAADGQPLIQVTEPSFSNCLESERIENVSSRSLSKMEENVNSSGLSTSETSTIVPRKRSRKGKAYKLDTLCLKLQERQTNSPIHKTGNDLDMDVNFECFQPIQAISEKEEDPLEYKDKFKEEKVDDPAEPTGNKEKGTNEIDAPATSNNHYQEDTGIKSDIDDTMDYDDRREKEVPDKKYDNIEETNSNQKLPMKISEDKHDGENDRSFTNEAEYELAKLQRTLNILVKEPSLERSVEDVEGKGKQKEKSNGKKERQTGKVNYCKEIVYSDTENSGDVTKTNEQALSEDDEGDQVEMINTVLENRKKPLPPAIRRGTELAWKLLNDRVNPVTSLPLPVESSPPPIQSKKLLHSSGNSASLSTPVNRSSPVRNSVRHPPALPFHSPSHLNGQSVVSVPLPPTPMAYIPPTNRIMPEPFPAPPFFNMVPPLSQMAASPVSNAPQQNEMYRCPYCHISFDNCVMYTVHMGYHSNCNPFKCNSCGTVSQDKVEFFLHMARASHK